MKHFTLRTILMLALMGTGAIAWAKNPNATAEASVQQQRYVVVDGTNVRLRFAPNLNSSWLHKDNGEPLYAPKGSKLTYLGQTNDFYKVSYVGKVLYISKQYSYLSDAQSSFYVVINGVNVRLRTGPGTNYPYFTWNDGSPCYLPKGTYLKYLGQSNDFYKADYQGKTVYVSKKFSYLTK